MALQQGTGYRDPAKAMTIKALQERQKMLAQAQAETVGNVASINQDPLSGFAHLASILGGGIQQGRIDSREADARQQLANVMAKIDPTVGPTQAQLAEMQLLDPDFANKQYELAMKQRFDIANREDDQSFRAGESKLERDARIAEQNSQQAAAQNLQDDQQAAAAKLAEDNDKRAAAEAVLADERADQNAKDEAAATLKKLEQEAGLRGKTPSEIAQAVKDGRITPEVGKKLTDAAILEATPEGWRDFTPEERKAAGVADGVVAQVNTKTGEKKVGSYPQQSAAQNAVDTQIAKDVNEWDTTGKATLASNMAQVAEALKSLQPGGSTTGSWGETLGIGQTGPVAGVMPEVAHQFFNPDMIIARDAIRSAVQESMKATLGSQFTEKEGSALMERAFSMGVRPEENVRRAQLIMQKLQQVAEAKDAQSAYYRAHGGIMKDYVPPPIDLEAIKREVSSMFKGDGDGAGAPAAADAPPAGLKGEDLVKWYRDHKK